MLVVFPPILVADTKIIYGYNFVAPLMNYFSFKLLLFPSNWISDTLPEALFMY